MLGGRIEITSMPGEGSTFSVFIPTGPLAGVDLNTGGPTGFVNIPSQSAERSAA